LFVHTLVNRNELGGLARPLSGASNRTDRQGPFIHTFYYTTITNKTLLID
jgi:hypothetical protein